MTTLGSWWNERITGAFVAWIQKAPDTVATLMEGVILRVFEGFSGWDWVSSAIVAGAESWIAKQTPERVALLVESGIEGWVLAQEAANGES